ncbi:insecticidal delta-endotoxin Cry8Ea1 family protein (plasmid) [Bacillus thuringiensis]|uniref:insecticidal delta-endotoxin Cry8Ea1 family protein n=1 Tax=Bacillus thuringiensis TaxID=1428 RepID=UPI0022242594|nr:insecticidal delta-endotoxin Cry8Ea1 family protein [Bacillus thuringiensis]UYX56166.1 insecticidal delta-endotoxin Cry8Ea1 family protein [Bacillus thuringiensis]
MKNIKPATSYANVLNNVSGEYEDYLELMNEIKDSIISGDLDDIGGKIVDGTLTFEDVARTAIITGVGEIPFVGSFFSAFLGLLWPSHALTLQEIWDGIKEKVEALIDEKLAEDKYNTLVSLLEGLSKQSTDLKKAIINHPKSPKKLASEREVQENTLKTLFWSTHTAYNTNVPSFAVKGYEVLSLPLYTQAANAHLLLLRDGLINADNWGFDDEDKKDITTYLKENIIIYSQTVRDNFKKGIDDQKTKANKITDKELMKLYGDGNDPRDAQYYYRPTYIANQVNKYIRGMTLTVLDFVAFWPTYDPTLYASKVSTQLARYVYSDYIGCPYKGEFHGYDPDELVQSMDIGGGSYPGELTQLEIWSYDRIDSVINSFKEEVGYYNWDKVGGTGGTKSTLTISDSNPIVAVKTGSQWTPSSLTFTYSNGQTTTCGKGIGAAIWNDYKFKGHKLAALKGWGLNTNAGFNSLDSCVLWFQTLDTTQHNVIGEKIYTCVPAMKLDHLDRFEPQTEYLNGGKAMKTTQKGASITYKIQTVVSGTYKVRYRLSTTDHITLKIGYKINPEDNFTYGDPTNITPVPEPDPNSGNGVIPGEYGNYKVIDGPTIKLQEGRNIVQLVNVSEGSFSLDKLEFMIQSADPFDPLMGECVVVAKHSSKVLSFPNDINNGNVVQQKNDGAYGKIWKFEYDTSTSSYKIINSSGRVLSLDDDNQNVVQNNDHGLKKQRWTLENSNDLGYYWIRNLENGLVLDVGSSSMKDYANVMVWELNKTDDNKKWRMAHPYPLEQQFSVKVKHSGKALTFTEDENNGNVVQLEYDSKNSKQRWQFEYDTLTSSYKIINHSGRVLSLDNDNQNVVQNNDHGLDKQRWILEPCGYGYYWIKNLQNGLVLDVGSSSMEDYANVMVWELNKTDDNKKWGIYPI